MFALDHPIARLRFALKGRDSKLGRVGKGILARAAHRTEVAVVAHATVRTLQRRLKQSSGYTVKNVTGLMRLDLVRNQLWLHPDINLARLAAEPGDTPINAT